MLGIRALFTNIFSSLPKYIAAQQQLRYEHYFSVKVLPRGLENMHELINA